MSLRRVVGPRYENKKALRKLKHIDRERIGARSRFEHLIWHEPKWAETVSGESGILTTRQVDEPKITDNPSAVVTVEIRRL
jgi:hypothetical protein